MPHCFCDSRLRMTASTAEAPLLSASVFLSPHSAEAPAFPQVGGADREQPRQKPPRSPGPTAKSAPISCETAQKSRGRARRRSRGSRCPCSQTNACTKRTANHRVKALMENASRTPYPPLQKATLSHPRQPTKKVTHNYQKSPWRSVIPRFSIVKCRQQISHGNTVPCVAKPPPAIREVTP